MSNFHTKTIDWLNKLEILVFQFVIGILWLKLKRTTVITSSKTYVQRTITINVKFTPDGVVVFEWNG